MFEKRALRNRVMAGIGVALSAALLSVQAACAPAAQPTPQPAAPSNKVRAGYIATDLHHIPHIVARDQTAGGGQSLYEKDGVSVEDAVGAPYADGGVVMDHIAAGDVDIALLGLPPSIIKTLNAGVDTTVLAQVNEIGSSLVVSKTINRFSDLAGKTVATPSHSSIQFFLLLTLAEKEGVDPSTMTIIDMPVKDMQARLGKGDIAGFVAWQPFPAQAVYDGAGKILANSEDIWPNHPDCVVVANRKFAREHPDAVKGFLRAHATAIQWVNDAKTKPDSREYQLLVDLGMKFTGRNADVVKEGLKGINYKVATDAGFRDGVTQFTNKLIQFKIVPSERLQERGYKTAADFTAAFVQPLP